jgi:hypothetical protein
MVGDGPRKETQTNVQYFLKNKISSEKEFGDRHCQPHSARSSRAPLCPLLDPTPPSCSESPYLFVEGVTRPFLGSSDSILVLGDRSYGWSNLNASEGRNLKNCEIKEGEAGKNVKKRREDSVDPQHRRDGVNQDHMILKRLIIKPSQGPSKR